MINKTIYHLWKAVNRNNVTSYIRFPYQTNRFAEKCLFYVTSYVPPPTENRFFEPPLPFYQLVLVL